LAKNSVLYHGPKISESLGEKIPASTLPEFSGVELSTLNRYQS